MDQKSGDSHTRGCRQGARQGSFCGVEERRRIVRSALTLSNSRPVYQRLLFLKSDREIIYRRLYPGIILGLVLR